MRDRVCALLDKISIVGHSKGCRLQWSFAAMGTHLNGNRPAGSVMGEHVGDYMRRLVVEVQSALLRCLRFPDWR